MNYQYRNEVLCVKRAAMGEMFQLAKENLNEEGKLINFASGHPNTEMIPDKLIRKYINLALEESDCGQDFFQYDIQGYMPLRKELEKFANKKGNVIKIEDDMIITYGSTEAVYLVASALVNCGDRVIVEVPTYVNAIKTFQLLGGDIIGVPMEEDGVNLDELENIMRYKGGGIAFLYYPEFWKSFWNHDVPSKT